MDVEGANKEPLFLKVYIWACEDHFNNLMNLLCNGNVPWMLKVLYGIIDANKKTLFLRVYIVYRNV